MSVRSPNHFQMAPSTCEAAEPYLRNLVRSIPDFPIKGVRFKDITPLIADARGLRVLIDALCTPWCATHLDAVVAIEARGFIVGAAVAYQLGTGLILVRKPGKLPADRDAFSYACEYSTGTLEVHRGVLRHGARCLIVDDVLATGGTARATADYLRKIGAAVAGYAFALELVFLNGRSRLADAAVHSVLRY